MQYHYQGKDREGHAVASTLEAPSRADAQAQLKAKGLFVMQLAEATAANTPSRGGVSSWRRRRVSKNDLVTMTSQLTIMLQSGVDLADALRNLGGNYPQGALKQVLLSLHEDVTSGESFSKSLRAHPRVFDAAFVAAVAAAEQTGDLLQGLERLSIMLRNQKRLSSSIWALLTYPLLLCAVTGVALSGMVFFVLPQFSDVFAGFDHPAPPLTQLLLDFGKFARAHWPILLGTAFATAASLAWFGTRPAARHVWSYLLMHTLLVRNATRTLATGRLFRLLGTMLQSGVSLLDGIRLCRTASNNYYFRGLFQVMETELINGQGISSSLTNASFLPAGAAQMIATAERSGKLAQVLQSVGQYYEEEGENKVRGLVKLLEPALIIGLGVVVGSVVLCVMLPLFDASTMVH